MELTRRLLEVSMADNENGTASTETISSNELFQLRDILFGEDKREFEAHFKSLEDKTNKQLDQLNQYIDGELADLKQIMDKGFAKLSEQLSDQDHLHCEREDQLQQFADDTADKLARFEKNTHHKTSEILSKLEQDTTTISNDFNAQMKQALAQLEQMANSLDNTKTDRELLANILSSAAQQISEAEK